MGTGSFPGVESGRDVTLTPHPLLVPRSRNSRAIPLLSLRVFVACKKGETYQNTLCEISEPRDIIYTNLYIPAFPLLKFLTLFLTDCKNVKALVQKIKPFEVLPVQETERLLNIQLQSYTD
jgi:hypothetical protein